MAAESARAHRHSMIRRPFHSPGAATMAAPASCCGFRGPVSLFAIMALGSVAGCVPPQSMATRGALDSLRVVVDTLVVRDSVALRVLGDMRRELAEQRDILLSTRASSGTTTHELFDQMNRLGAKLDETMGRFSQSSSRAP